MSATIRRVAAVLAALVAVGACSGTEPTSGTMNLTLSGAVPVRAVQVRLVGRATAIVTPGQGVRLFVDTLGVDTVMIMVVAPAGQTLPSAYIGQIQVPDTRVAASYQVQLLQVAAPDYSQQNPSSFVLTITAAPGI